MKNYIESKNLGKKEILTSLAVVGWNINCKGGRGDLLSINFGSKDIDVELFSGFSYKWV